MERFLIFVIPWSQLQQMRCRWDFRLGRCWSIVVGTTVTIVQRRTGWTRMSMRFGYCPKSGEESWSQQGSDILDLCYVAPWLQLLSIPRKPGCCRTRTRIDTTTDHAFDSQPNGSYITLCTDSGNNIFGQFSESSRLTGVRHLPAGLESGTVA